MSDPFNILGDELDAPPTFDVAVREAVSRLEESANRFAELQAEIPEDRITEDEWSIIESTAEQLVEAIERAEEGYVAVMYDSHAWYRILENLEKVQLRLESTIGLLERVKERSAGS